MVKPTNVGISVLTNPINNERTPSIRVVYDGSSVLAISAIIKEMLAAKGVPTVTFKPAGPSTIVAIALGLQPPSEHLFSSVIFGKGIPLKAPWSADTDFAVISIAMPTNEELVPFLEEFRKTGSFLLTFVYAWTRQQISPCFKISTIGDDADFFHL